MFLSKLRQKRNGCHIGSYFVGAILYADDLIVLSASVSGLQRCLNTVFCVSMELQLEFNCKKSCCIAFGARYNNAIHLFNLVLSFLGGTQLLSIWALFSVLELLLMLTQM